MWRSIRALPAPVWWLYVGSFVNRFGSFVSVFLILYLVELGFTPAQAGTAAAAYGAGSFGASIVGGFLADRLGRRNAMALSMFSAAATALALSQAEGLVVITALTAAFGLTSDLYRPASAALLADLVPAERRLPAFAGYRLAINAGFTFGPAVAGLLAERSFFWLFIGEAATSTTMGVIALVALPVGVRTRRGEERRGEGIRSIAGDRSFVVLLLAVAISAFVYLQSFATLPLHIRDAGLSTTFYGLLISLNGGLIVLLELPLVSQIRRFSAPRAIATGVAVSGIGFGALAFGAHPGLLIAAAVTWTIGEIVAAPTGNAYVANLAPHRLRGRYQGALGMTFSLGLVLAPAIGTRIYDWSPVGLWTICGALSFVAAAMILPLPSRRVEPDIMPPPTAPDLPGVET